MKDNMPFKHNIKETTLEELRKYLQPEVYIEYCKQCMYYNKIWACPPYDFEITKILKDYQFAYIIGSKLYIKDLDDNLKELLDKKDLEYAINKIHTNSRLVLDEKLDRISKEGKHLQTLLAGRCMICDICTREKHIPCIHPEKMLYSLEAIGFDVSSICQDILGEKMLWASEGMPEYFIFVSAVLSQEKLTVKDIYNSLE